MFDAKHACIGYYEEVVLQLATLVSCSLHTCTCTCTCVKKDYFGIAVSHRVAGEFIVVLNPNFKNHASIGL